MLELAADINKRSSRVPQAQEIAAQQIEALHLGLTERGPENAILNRFGFAVHRLEHRHVIVDDGVEDSVEDVVLAVSEHGRRGLAELAHRRIGG